MANEAIAARTVRPVVIDTPARRSWRKFRTHRSAIMGAIIVGAFLLVDAITEVSLASWTRHRELRRRADEVLDFLTIRHLTHEKAGNLSGGQKKLLELGRTMMVDAKIVFLDEVGAGVNRTLLMTIADAILRLNRERGYTFCVIEHDMDFIGKLCDPVIVMAEGKVLAQGSAAHIMENEAVIEAYLGTGLKNKDMVGA